MTTRKFTPIPASLPGALLIEPRVFGDSRGFFLESYTRRDMEALGIQEEFVQDNHSRSAKGVLRGLHFQYPCAQSKLVRVARGAIYDVIVDIRQGSPSFGRHESFLLSEENHRMLYVPVGFAHGFLALSDGTEILYKTGEYYHPEADAGIRWNDPDLSIPWPLREHGIESPLLSEKDARLPLLSDLESPFAYRGEDP
ncbi:MAG: dTDP-4-dehydrorhamnose 3,5-epimerase [Methanolinea sp.]|jgi:dTDP-4-dehydrorhamnose 3,5-epimerase|nr:dTDP-4-dehydrorhamnose 3,5-epimerase [Methanolinea sp.]